LNGVRRALVSAMWCVQLASCALPRAVPDTQVVPTQSNVRRELKVETLEQPFDVVTVTRVRGALRFHVTTKQRCRTDVMRAVDVGFSNGRVERGTLELENSHEGPCAGPMLPAAALDIGVSAGPRLHVLGRTSQTGDLEVRLSTLDVLFADPPVALNALGQVLVHGVKGAEIPLGEILHRGELIEATLTRVDRAIADAETPRELLAQRLAELLDLQLQGADDARIATRMQLLYMRMSSNATPGATPPSAGAPPTPPELQPDMLDQIQSAIPTLCKITISGGEAIIGQLTPLGPAGLALSFMVNYLDDSLTQWLTNRCCVMASGSLSDAETTDCHTKPTETAAATTP